MLYTSRLSTAPKQSLIHYAIFNQTGRPRQVDCSVPLWEYRCKVSFQRHNDALLSSRTDPRVDNLEVANWRSDPPLTN